MTSPKSPPNRRRRRIVVTVAILLLGSLSTWWFSARRDARFLGKWRQQTGLVIELRGGGFGTFHGTGGIYGYQAIHWSVDGDQLLLSTWVPYWHQYLFHMGRLALGRGRPDPLAIVEVSNDQLRFKQSDGGVQTWTRIVE
jgi:hypothetical protein